MKELHIRITVSQFYGHLVDEMQQLVHAAGRPAPLDDFVIRKECVRGGNGVRFFLIRFGTLCEPERKGGTLRERLHRFSKSRPPEPLDDLPIDQLAEAVPPASQLLPRFVEQGCFVRFSRVEKNLADDAVGVKLVAKELPDDMALTSFKFSEAGTAQIEGTTLQMEGISELMRRVETSSILQNGRFDYLTEKEFEEQKYFQFGIMARLRDLREKIQ